MTKRIHTIAAALLFLCGLTQAQDHARWDSVTAADWAVTMDSSKGWKNAGHLFEKVTIDDANLNHGERMMTFYHRVRIFNAKGRVAGDVIVRYFDRGQDVDNVEGRTILRDGTIIRLPESQVYDEERVTDEKTTVRQKKFSLPGVTDDCIIEYFYRKRTYGGAYAWHFQEELPLLRGELRWTYFRPMDQMNLFHMPTRIQPSYQWVGAAGRVDRLPDTGDPDEYIFSVHDIPGIDPEPLMPDPESFASKLVLYYRAEDSDEGYWIKQADNLREGLEKFRSRHRGLDDYLERFKAFATPDEKIRAVYAWVQSDFTNVGWVEKPADGKKFKKNDALTDVLDHHYGSSFDLNMLFAETLKQLGVDVSIAYVMERSDGPFFESAEYPQFTRPVVVINNNGKTGWYYPAIPGNAPGMIADVSEGCTAMVLRGEKERPHFVTVPFSPADSNRVNYRYDVAVGENGALTGHFTSQRRCQAATYIRGLMYGAAPQERGDRYKEFLKRGIEKVDLDSIELGGLDSATYEITARGKISIPGCVQAIGKKYIVTPFVPMIPTDNPFTAERRNNPIDLRRAQTTVEEMVVRLPEGYRVTGIPADSSYVDEIGACSRQCSVTDSTFMLRRVIKRYGVVFPPEAYPRVQKLCHALEVMDRTPFVLEENVRVTTGGK